MEEARTEGFLHKVGGLASDSAGRVEIEIFFDGPRREFRVQPGAPVRVRFAIDGDADAAILGSARRLRSAGRGVVVVTEDSRLAGEVQDEGGRAMRLAEFMDRLRGGTA